MKAIVCQLCGSNELVKEGDYFVCQACGTKYTLEDARKLFVEVKGPVTINHEQDFENVMTNAWRALQDNDFPTASQLFSQALNYNPDDHNALFFRAYAAARCGDPVDFRAQELVNAYERSINAMRAENAPLADTFSFMQNAVEIMRQMMELSINSLITYRDQTCDAIQGEYNAKSNQANASMNKLSMSAAANRAIREVRDTIKNAIAAIDEQAQRVIPLTLDLVDDYDDASNAFWHTLTSWNSTMGKLTDSKAYNEQAKRVDSLYAVWRERFLYLHNLKDTYDDMQGKIAQLEQQADDIMADRKDVSIFKHSQRKELKGEAKSLREQADKLRRQSEALFDTTA